MTRQHAFHLPSNLVLQSPLPPPLPPPPPLLPNPPTPPNKTIFKPDLFPCWCYWGWTRLPKTWIQTHSLRLQHTHTHTTDQVAKQSSLKKTHTRKKRLLLTWARPQKPKAGIWYHCHQPPCKLYTEIYSSKQSHSSGIQHVIDPFHSLTQSSLYDHIVLYYTAARGTLDKLSNHIM